MSTGNEVRRACFFFLFRYARIWTQSPDHALNLDFRSIHVWYVRVILTFLFQDLDQDSGSGFSQKIQSPRTNYKNVLSLTILIFLAFDLEFICFASESNTQVVTIPLKSKSKSCRVSFSWLISKVSASKFPDPIFQVQNLSLLVPAYQAGPKRPLYFSPRPSHMGWPVIIFLKAISLRGLGNYSSKNPRWCVLPYSLCWKRR